MEEKELEENKVVVESAENEIVEANETLINEIENNYLKIKKIN